MRTLVGWGSPHRFRSPAARDMRQTRMRASGPAWAYGTALSFPRTRESRRSNGLQPLRTLTRDPGLQSWASYPKLGSFCTFCLRRPARPGPNWVRFAQSYSGGTSRPAGQRPFPGARARLGLFCTIPSATGLRRGKLGSFCTFHSPGEPRPTRQLPLPTYPSPLKFGFVSHDFLGQPPATGRNWVRFARLPCSY
jgi:hypothetical protein